MKSTSFKIRDLILLAGVIVAILVAIFAASTSFTNEPGVDPAKQESSITNEATGSLATGIFALVFKNGLELIQVLKESN